MRSRDGGEHAKNKFSGASVRWSIDVTADTPQKELALTDAGLFLSPLMADGYTLICPTGEKADPTSEVTCAPVKGSELQFAQFVEGLIDAGVHVPMFPVLP